MRLVLATANPHKTTEIRSILAAAGVPVELVPRPDDVPDVVEDAPDLEGNARLKAAALAVATGLPALSDDTGLEVDALDGRPGVRSARYAGEDGDAGANIAKLLGELAAVPAEARTARFRTVVMVRWPDGHEVTAAGAVDGVIADAPRGAGGFGYDPVFLADEGGGRSFAEMDAAAKDAISHRGRALRALAALLAEG
jgi:XTP/dITP diphosphohydrolase